MKFEHTQVWGFEHAIRGMRNPKDSWAKIDSHNCEGICAEGLCGFCDEPSYNDIKCDEIGNCGNYIAIGPNDMKLMQSLIKGGSEHRKFMRQIFVSVDITAPFYWWKEFDTYKVGTVANSCSTMHKLTAYPIELESFEIDDFNPDLVYWVDDTGDSNPVDWTIKDEIEDYILFLERLRKKYLETKDKRFWKELVRWLPEGWSQKRTVTMNYENLYSIVHQRSNHKLNEWSGKDNPGLPHFIDWIYTLPYAEMLLFDVEDKTVIEKALDRIPDTISQKHWEKRAEKFLNDHGVQTRNDDGSWVNSHDLFIHMGQLVPEEEIDISK